MSTLLISIRVYEAMSKVPVGRMAQQQKALHVLLRMVALAITKREWERTELEEDLKKMRCEGLPVQS